MRVMAVDVGASNTAAMIQLPDGRTRPLLFDGHPLLPSALYVHADGRVITGRGAERDARLDPARFTPSLRQHVGDGPDPGLVAHLLSTVMGEARRQYGAEPDEVRLTHPPRMGLPRHWWLIDAARMAGLPAPRLIAAPVAAATCFTVVLGTAVPVGRGIAVYDLGGGTFDATVVRRTPAGFEVLATQRLPDAAGLAFDDLILAHLDATYGGASRPQSRLLLAQDVRGVKETLSRDTGSDIHLPALDVNAHLTRAQFEALVRPVLDRTVDCLRRVIESSGLAPGDLAGVFLTGGSSRIPLVTSLIHAGLGVVPTAIEVPELAVVEGALHIWTSPASRASASWRPQPVPQRPVGGILYPQWPHGGPPVTGRPAQPPGPSPR